MNPRKYLERDFRSELQLIEKITINAAGQKTWLEPTNSEHNPVGGGGDHSPIKW